MAIFTRTIAAGAREVFSATGTFIRIMSGAETMLATIEPAPGLSGDAGQNPVQELELELGIGFVSPFPFSSVTLYNPTASPVNVRLSVVYGTILDNRVVGQVLITGGIQDKGANGITYKGTTLSAGVDAEIAVSNSNGREVIIRTALADLFVGEEGVTAATGIPIVPNQNNVLSFNGSLWGISTTGGDVKTWMMENA